MCFYATSEVLVRLDKRLHTMDGSLP
jgi:hypothetical protein